MKCLIDAKDIMVNEVSQLCLEGIREQAAGMEQHFGKDQGAKVKFIQKIACQREDRKKWPLRLNK